MKRDKDTSRTILENIDKNFSIFEISKLLSRLFGRNFTPSSFSEGLNENLKRMVYEGIVSKDEASYLYFYMVARKYGSKFPPFPSEGLELVKNHRVEERFRSIMEKHRVIIGFKRVNSKEVLFVAGPNPFSVDYTISMLEKSEVKETIGFLAPEFFVQEVISSYTYFPISRVSDGDFKYRNAVKVKREKGLAIKGEELFGKIMEEALKDKATDIHILPLEGNSGAIVDFRMSMALIPKFRLYESDYAKLRAYFLSSMNIDDKPYAASSAAKTFVTSEGKKVRYRFSSMPVLGEAFSDSVKHSYVIRIHKDFSIINLDSLRIPSPVKNSLKNAIRKRSGIIVVSGATGSGKSTTILSCLNFIKESTKGSKRIITLEDPVEVLLPGVVQSEINENAGYTFSKGLREALRHDPDIIFVGEVRDEDSARLVTQAAVTGHLVFTTIHSFSLEEIPLRFASLGVDPMSLIGASLLFLEQVRIREYPAGGLYEVEKGGNIFLEEPRSPTKVKKYARDRVLFSALELDEKFKSEIYSKGFKAWRDLVKERKFPDIKEEIQNLYKEKKISTQQYFEFFSMEGCNVNG